MKYCLPLLLLIIFSFFSQIAFAEISIEYPSTRAIFQRDRNNFATIYIRGRYTQPVDRIEAKVIAMQGGNNTEWFPIQTNPQGGFFNGGISVSGGWYELSVRGMKGDQEVDISRMGPVGVGEVFIIAGQSNAEGFLNNNGYDFGVQSAADDRVNCINATYDNPDFPKPFFSHLNSDSRIAPRGKSAWCWGKLGDLLANRYNVPILFYNAAWDGTIVRSWRESITGTAKSPYVNANYEPSGMPFNNLRAVLQSYVSMTGARSVLWLQGEGDNQFNVSTDSYYQDLKTVIEASRNVTGLNNLAWVVALTSYTNAYGSDPAIIEGQKRTINQVPNVFQGPNTDAIQAPRTDPEGLHIHHDGLITLGEAWSNQLNDDFFSRSEPFPGISPPQISGSCAGNGNVTLSIGGGDYSSVQWSTGQNSGNVQVGNGTYSAKVRDNRGNIFFTPDIRVTESIQPPQVTISLEGSNPVCIGNTATLVSSISQNIVWNTGALDSRLPVTTGGEYFVTIKSIYGCESTSGKINVSVLNSPLPAKPSITALGPVEFCDGGEVKLQSNSTATSIWSNGGRTATITVNSSGDYRVQALDNVGCYSPLSDAVTVKVNALPAKPSISLNGPATFCQGGNVVLTSSYDSGNTWSNAAVTKTITAASSGTFTLKQRDSKGCESTSDPVAIKVNALPATPTVTALRPTTFCLRDYTTLRSSEAFSYLWSNGTTSRDITIRTSGSFTIAAKDANGCVSPVSAAVAVVANPLPVTPVITADGPTTFCADLSVNLQSTPAIGFLWTNGSSSQTLKVTTAGTYSVQTINEFQCYSDPSNKISTQTLALPPAPIITALGITTFCDGDFVALKASRGSAFIWNTGAEKDSIHVLASGSYTAKAKDSKGCFSPSSPAIAVDVKPTPTAPTIRQTGVYTLLAENNINGGHHVWQLNGTVLPDTTITLKAAQSGTYTVDNSVTYSATLTCASEFSEPYIFYADTRNNGLAAYPNPLTDGKITIETLQNVNNAVVQVIDSRGNIHKAFTVKRFDRQQFFDISDLSAGLYFIRVVSTSFTATQKVMIVK